MLCISLGLRVEVKMRLVQNILTAPGLNESHGLYIGTLFDWLTLNALYIAQSVIRIEMSLGRAVMI